MGSKRYEEDFKIIRTAIDSAKNPIDKLGQFFKNYAMINIIIVALNLIVNLYQGLAMDIYCQNDMFCLSGILYYSNVQRRKKQYKSILSSNTLYLWNRCGCNTSNFMDCKNYKISYFE